MSRLLKITTSPESWFIETSTGERVYSECLLPAFSRLSHNKIPFQLKKQELMAFKEILENDLRERTANFQPRNGQGPVRIIFGKEYLLTKLSKEHQIISTLYYVHKMTDECIENDKSMNFEYAD